MRGVKPELFTDSKIVRLSPLARYLFIGLWTQACDNGHVDNDEMEIKIRLLPADNADVTALLDEIEAVGLISTTPTHITIPNLPKHQRIDSRWFKTCDMEGCEKPEIAADGTDSRAPHDENTTGPQRGHDENTTGPRDELRGIEGEGEGKGARRATTLPADWSPIESHAKKAREYGLDLNWQSEKFKNNATAKGLTYKNWNSAFHTWLQKEVEFAARDGRTNVTPIKTKTREQLAYEARNGWMFR